MPRISEKIREQVQHSAQSIAETSECSPAEDPVFAVFFGLSHHLPKEGQNHFYVSMIKLLPFLSGRSAFSQQHFRYAIDLRIK